MPQQHKTVYFEVVWPLILVDPRGRRLNQTTCAPQRSKKTIVTALARPNLTNRHGSLVTRGCVSQLIFPLAPSMALPYLVNVFLHNPRGTFAEPLALQLDLDSQTYVGSVEFHLVQEFSATSSSTTPPSTSSPLVSVSWGHRRLELSAGPDPQTMTWRVPTPPVKDLPLHCLLDTSVLLLRCTVPESPGQSPFEFCRVGYVVQTQFLGPTSKLVVEPVDAHTDAAGPTPDDSSDSEPAVSYRFQPRLCA